jgi:hypothetical protein
MTTGKITESVQPYSGLYADRNDAIDVQVTASHVIVTTRDQRVIHVPIAWFPWLENATPDQRQDFENHHTSIHWNSLDEGVSMQVVLLGRHDG